MCIKSFHNNIQQILSIFSFIFCLIFILFHKWLIPSDNLVFGWIFIAFMIVSNLPYLSGIITNIVKSKVEEHITAELTKQIKNRLIKEDPDLINKLANENTKNIEGNLKKASDFSLINTLGMHSIKKESKK